MQGDNCIMQIFVNRELLFEQSITNNGEYILNIDLENRIKKNIPADIYKNKLFH